MVDLLKVDLAKGIPKQVWEQVMGPDSRAASKEVLPPPPVPSLKAAWETLRREFEVQVLVWEALRMSRRPLREAEFCVVLDRRRGEKLGLRLDKGGEGLKVGHIGRPGLVHEWNSKGRGHPLQGSDDIIQVNECQDVDGMCQELEKHEVLAITLRRGPSHEAASAAAAPEADRDLESLMAQMEAILKLSDTQPDGAVRALEASLLSARETGKLPLNDAMKSAARRVVEASLRRDEVSLRRDGVSAATPAPGAARGQADSDAARRLRRLQGDVLADLERDMGALPHETAGGPGVPQLPKDILAAGLGEQQDSKFSL